MSEIRGAWGNFDTTQRGDLYAEELAQMAKDYGRSRVEAAIRSVIRNGCDDGKGEWQRSFAPTIAQLRQTAEQQGTGFTAETNPTCDLCHGTGFRTTRIGDRFAPVTRCSCWKVVSA